MRITITSSTPQTDHRTKRIISKKIVSKKITSRPKQSKKKNQAKKLNQTDILIQEISVSLQQLHQKIKLDPPSNSLSEIITHTLRQHMDEKQVINDESVDHTKIIQWAYHQSKVCEICNRWNQEQKLMLCDACEDAYHSNCLNHRKQTKSVWLCPPCVKSRKINDQLVDDKQKKISDIYQSIEKEKQCKVCLQNLNNTLDQNKKCLKCQQKFHSECFTPKNKSEFLCQFCAKQTLSLLKNCTLDKYLKTSPQQIQTIVKRSSSFLFPKQLSDPEKIEDCKMSLLFALQTQGIQYSDDLVYEEVEDKHNNPEFEPLLQKLGHSDLEMFQRFKQFTRYANYGPFQVFHQEQQGFVVRAMARVPKLTLICEYTGQVKRYRDVVFSKNDSIMTLLRTGRAETTLVIEPEKYGNLAKYLSGINNYDSKLKLKQNVASIRYDVQGRVKVLLYASRHIKEGEILYYDYNAGGHSNYDTTYFV